MIATLYSWLLPPTALRWGRLTKAWPWAGPISDPTEVLVPSTSLRYVIEYLRRYDRMPSDEAPHTFWTHWGVIDEALGPREARS